MTSCHERPLINLQKLFDDSCIHKVIVGLTYKQPFNHSFIISQKPPAPRGVNLETSCHDAIALTSRAPILIGGLLFSKIVGFLFKFF